MRKTRWSTLAGYKHVIKKRLNPKFGYFLMTDIHLALIQSYVTERMQDIDARRRKKEEGKKAKSPKKLVSPKTIANEVVVIKEMFKHALQWGYVKVNPAEHLQKPRMVKPEIEILEPAEFMSLLEHSSDLYRVAFRTAIITGVRAGELWALQWDAVDWDIKRLYVHQSIWKNNFQTPKSKKSIRKIDLPDDLVFELRRWKLACPISKHNLMFPSKEGQITCHDNAVKRHFKPALRKAGLQQVSFHSLRHTNASLRIRAGQDFKYMSTQMGHSSINITLDTYGHLFNDQDFNRQQVDLLQKAFDPVRNPLEKSPKNAKKGLAFSANPL